MTALTTIAKVTAYTTGYVRDGKTLVWMVTGYVGKDWRDQWWIRWMHREEQEDVGPFDSPTEAAHCALRIANLRDAYLHALRERFGNSLLRSTKKDVDWTEPG